jgi:acyl-CoA synthetase (NDP forming)
MNTAIQDAYDLGWKLSCVLCAWARQELLNTYEAERRPVGAHNVDFAAGAMGVEKEVAVIEKLATLDNIDGIITSVPRDRSLRTKTLAEQRMAVITAVDTFCRLPGRYGKPIIARSANQRSPFVEDLLQAAGIPIYQSVEECSLAAYALARYGRIRCGD